MSSWTKNSTIVNSESGIMEMNIEIIDFLIVWLASTETV